MRCIALLVLCGCGRIAFDPLLDTGDGGDAGSADGGTPTLLIHFTFDTMLLREEYGHDATCTACPLPVVGKTGFAAAFDGTKCLMVPNTASLTPSTFTFALWAQATGQQYGTAFGRPYNGATTVENTFELFVDTFDIWSLGINTSYVGRSEAQNQWHHVAVTSNGTGYVSYIDGAEIGFNDTVGAARYSGDDILIGCDLNAGVIAQYFIGIIDDIRIYDGVLQAGQIAALAM